MNKTVQDCRSLVHNKLLLYRSLHNLINTTIFEMAYLKATEQEKEQIWQYIEKEERDRLAQLIKQINYEDITQLPMKDLRKLAQELGVKNYAMLTKMSLLSDIMARTK